ncbi:MAG: thioredoxin family protein [Vicinamibacteria bacterium]
MSGLLLPLVLAAAAQTATPAPPRIKWERNFEEALKKAQKLGKPVVVDFWAEWCTWCERLDQNTYADPLVVAKSQDFVAVKVNTEGSRKAVDVAVRYHVGSLPTIVFLSPLGRQLGRVNGFQGPGQFPRTLDAVLAISRRVMGWEETLARNPDDPRALAGLGAHAYEQLAASAVDEQDVEEARDLLRRATAVDGDEPVDDRRRTRMLLAILENGSRNYPEAEKLVKEALALGPRGEDNPKLLFVLGRTYVSWGRRAEGVATMEIIVREYPQSPMAQKARETIVNLAPR